VSLSIEDFAPDTNVLRDSEEETWLDKASAAKSRAERDQALPLRASIMADLEKIKAQVRPQLSSRFRAYAGLRARLLPLREQNPTRQIRELLDMNEGKPPDARLPISTFDLDREAHRRRIQEARLEQEEVRRSIEEECARREQTVSYLREILWDPLLVKPCALRSIDGDTTVRNYPLVAAIRRPNDVRVWDRLSADADEFPYRYLISLQVQERSDLS